MSAERLERRLAFLLSGGTALASTVLAIGFLAALRYPLGMAVETAGIALFILLPVLRVALMLAGFALRRERVFAALAGAVLAIIALGTLLSLHGTG